MWQRIQTVFLVITILALIGSVLLPAWGLQSGEQNLQLFALNYMTRVGGAATYQYMPYAVSGILFIAAITVAVVQIRRFKNRMLQVKLGTFNSLLIVAGYGATVYFATDLLKLHGGVFGFGLYLPAVAVFFNWLAIRFIRRDEKLVRDSQRLR